jgi:hypothetical protein
MGSEHEVDVVPSLRHEMVQSFDMVVSQAARASLHTVVVATLPTLSTHDRAVIAQALAATRRPELAFLVESSPDAASAECADATNPETAAAAVAVVRAAQGCHRQDALTISLKWDGRNWQCQVD